MAKAQDNKISISDLKCSKQALGVSGSVTENVMHRGIYSIFILSKANMTHIPVLLK